MPIPSGGAQAALSGAKIRYVVGESLKSQWVVIARKEIGKPEDLKGKTVGYGRAGAADYDEGAAVLERFFRLNVGKDYKVISFQGEAERMAALINGDIQAALVSVPASPGRSMPASRCCCGPATIFRARAARSGRMKPTSDKNPATVKKVIRAIANGRDVFPRQQGGLDPDPEGSSRYPE